MSTIKAMNEPQGRDPQPQPGSTVRLHPQTDLIDYAKEYAREKPEVAALWCLGIGFILGWKLKPW